jgi:hypothetical protein
MDGPEQQRRRGDQRLPGAVHAELGQYLVDVYAHRLDGDDLDGDGV